ncbi:hypothetical protein LEP1GSC133_0138 [Leptospira borgpetersenii serovar Pomona str. 200901868]|uniref:Uncharacterized protein n=1 Tax=Leptospira borgpetersenii serovar Pomona str. 200901868 TaxID=1192866 RepID=M6W4W1_LEPBO|nr:hypothetical protein LEP1GSC133_0138 [Leptospira borgpetersenii serovar Pomona str. 200901868]
MKFFTHSLQNSAWSKILFLFLFFYRLVGFSRKRFFSNRENGPMRP